MPSNRKRRFNYFLSRESFVLNLLIKSETVIQRAPALNHSHLKPKCPANCEPPSGPSVWAADQAIVYNAAYCPLFAGLVRLIQKLFINGIEKISPNVSRVIMESASIGPIPGILSIRNAMPTISIPIKIKSRFLRLPSNL